MSAVDHRAAFIRVVACWLACMPALVVAWAFNLPFWLSVLMSMTSGFYLTSRRGVRVLHELSEFKAPRRR